MNKAANINNPTEVAMTELELAQLVEMSEARAYRSLITSAPKDVSDIMGFGGNP